MPLKQRSIFITGIAGFIGFHLAMFLKKRGDYVMGCDNFNPYYSVILKKERASQLKQEGIEVISCSIETPQFLNTLLNKHPFTHFVHLAAQAGVRYSIEHPMAYSDSNLVGFLHVLEECRHHQPMKLIFASSSSVYGSNKKIPFQESDSTDQPISLYAATKKAGELMAKSYHHLYHIPIVGLRYFTVYGPWGRPDMAYFHFSKMLLKKKPITFFNWGEMERDFTYIDDIVEGTAAALDFEGSFEIFNLGNHKSENLKTLITLLEKYLGNKAKINFKPMQKGDVIKTYADISKAAKFLSFKPKTSLEKGLKHFTDWVLMHKSAFLIDF